MLKRDPRLHGLSHDHHHTLVLARRAKRGATGKDPAGLWARVKEEFHTEVLPHFEVEERWMLPQLLEVGETEMVERSLREHAQLRELASRDEPALLELGELLAAHIRYEETFVFMTAQQRLTDEQLNAIEAARPAEES